MDIPKANFIGTKETEIERVAHTAKQTWSGFYLKKGFLVLPNLRMGGVREVVLPDIGLENIPDIEKILQKIKLNFPIKMPESFRIQVDKRLEFSEIRNDFEKDWKKVEKDFWNVMQVLVPKMAEKIKKVEVRVTQYGTICSYQFLTKDDENLVVYLRSDAQISNLAEAIMTALVYPFLDEMGIVWEESEAMVDFVLKNSILKKYFDKHKPTVSSLRDKLSEKDKIESNNFVKKLGITVGKPLQINHKKVELWGKSVDNKLTKKQNEMLISLLNKEGIILTFEEVSRILWGENEEKFSLWAMNKFIERLRLKLVDLGLSPFILKTVRGRGVSLEN